MIKNIPALGWNTWNTFGQNIDEKTIIDMADAMVETGLLAAGYEYLVIDDSWQERERDAQHRLAPNKKKFPNGMKVVADYVHSKGLKFGMYSCCGNLTCCEFPGSYGYEFIDAETFASWGVDYLKYDYCFRSTEAAGHLLYKRMGAALANCGRDILFSACSWGMDETHEWIKSTGAGMWRSTGDIFDTWESIKELYNRQIALQPYNGTGCFNDMDMLVVGMKGQGHVGLTGCTFEEYRTHFTLWALLNSPLMIGCDIRNMTRETKDILTNPGTLAINQDAAARQPYLVSSSKDCPVWIKLLANGDFAIGFFNLTDGLGAPYFSLSDIGLDRTTGRTLMLEDVWTGEIVHPRNDMVHLTLQAHDCRLFRAKVVEAN